VDVAGSRLLESRWRRSCAARARALRILVPGTPECEVQHGMVLQTSKARSAVLGSTDVLAVATKAAVAAAAAVRALSCLQDICDSGYSTSTCIACGITVPMAPGSTVVVRGATWHGPARSSTTAV
jgi:hypothetical protein